MKILIIDNHDSFTYNLSQMIEKSNCGEITIIKNERNVFDAKEFDKIVFSPGPGIPSEEAGLMNSILKKHSTTKSILGICLGHQAIAEFYGANLINLSEVIHGIKTKIMIKDNSDYLFKNIPGTIYGGLYHSWSVNKENFSECLNIIAMSEEGIIMGFSHKTFDVKGLQFHPESIMTDYGRKIINNWIMHKPLRSP